MLIEIGKNPEGLPMLKLAYENSAEICQLNQLCSHLEGFGVEFDCTKQWNIQEILIPLKPLESKQEKAPAEEREDLAEKNDEKQPEIKISTEADLARRYSLIQDYNESNHT